MQDLPLSVYPVSYRPALNMPDDFPIYLEKRSFSDPGDDPVSGLHVHDGLEIGYCLSGTGVFAVEDKVFPYSQGYISIINNREMHLLRNKEGETSEWIFIWVDPVRLIGVIFGDSNVLRIDALCGVKFRNVVPETEFPDIASLIHEIIKEYQDQKSDYRSAIRGLVWTLMARLQRFAGEMEQRKIRRAENWRPHEREEIDRLAPSLEYMASNYAEPLRIDDLAKLCDMSPTHFRRMFGKVVGCSPLKYLTHLRLGIATAQFHGPRKSMAEISREVGYPTLSSFNRHFRSIMGCSPREWKARTTEPQKG